MARDWYQVARDVLRAEMVRHGVTTRELAERLGEQERSVSNRLGRGRFSAAWFLQCLSLIGADGVRLP